MSVSYTGPLFDGKTAVAFEASSPLCRDALATRFIAVWKKNLNASIKNGTGFYISQIEAHTAGPETTKVDDRRVVYGPWLEGLGSRNYPKTVFRGYHALRKAKQQVQTEAMGICQPIINKILKGL